MVAAVFEELAKAKAKEPPIVSQKAGMDELDSPEEVASKILEIVENGAAEEILE